MEREIRWSLKPACDATGVERWLRESDMSVGRRLAQIGVLGWIFIVPTLAGLFLGRWLDARLETGIFWTAPMAWCWGSGSASGLHGNG
jgi:hypothetical protein